MDSFLSKHAINGLSSTLLLWTFLVLLLRRPLLGSIGLVGQSRLGSFRMAPRSTVGSAHVPEFIKSGRSLVVSMWFVAHEFSEGDPKVIRYFFRELNLKLPYAEIILGEITALPPRLLAEHHAVSIMPEMLLFHALSLQGVLSWENWQKSPCDPLYGRRGASFRYCSLI